MERLARDLLRTVAALGLTAVMLAQPGCAFLASLVQKPTVALKNVELTRIAFDGISAKFLFTVENPNPIGVDLAKLDYKVSLGGSTFVEGHADQPLHVPANGSGELVLPVSVKYVEFASSLASLFDKQHVPYKLETRLGFGSPVGVIEVPLSTSGSFPVPRLPDVSLDGASSAGVDVSGATMVLHLRVRNPNSFALPLGTLDYQVTLNGNRIASGRATPGEVAANATAPMPVSFHVDFLGGGASIVSALVPGGATRLAVNGDLDVGGFPLHFEKSTDLR